MLCAYCWLECTLIELCMGGVMSVVCVLLVGVYPYRALYGWCYECCARIVV